ncbi:hypothetical protein L4535_29535 [Pseudomonas aeruginosa]|uniref:Mor transcription activator family protein n=1 Tax=Pseudomonas aeruginosa TaxID=287 RepID=UPI001F2C64AB|nr:Mor transcription activator family protein [Pseudomonas aeruginosa]MCG0237039.1 hypothetical protein [Pseudomonas aeruginosa]
MFTIDTMSSDVINSLPDIVKDVIEKFGLDKADNLVSKLGGRTYWVAEGRTPKARERRKQLAEMIGEDVEGFINKRYQGKEIYIPRMKRIETLARHRRINVKAEELLGEGKPIRAVVTQLANEFAMSERSLWNILKQHGSVSEGA